ncbi:MAG: ion transporter [Sphingopyxis sp.]
MTLAGWRRRVYIELDPAARSKSGLSYTNLALLLLIIAAVITAIIETEPMVMTGHETLFARLQIIFGLIFGVEYLMRIWVAAETPDSGGDGITAWTKRWHFIRSPSAIIDLVVVLASLMPLITGNTAALRLLRLVRIIGLARLGRLSAAMREIGRAVHSRRYELAVTAGLATILITFGATSLYWLEGDIQPDKFGSIPRALWWAVVTITTIGYGDAFPITALGKMAATVVAVAGIGLIAMPTGILASAFSDAMQKHHGADGID